MNLETFLEERGGVILDQAERALHRARLAHYESGGQPVAHERLEVLLQRVRESAKAGDLCPVVAHAERIARERFASGHMLHEVQTAFNVLEEAIWVRIVAEVPLEEQPRALGLVSTILGAGKDALAREYVALATRVHSQAVDTDALMRGM